MCWSRRTCTLLLFSDSCIWMLLPKNNQPSVRLSTCLIQLTNCQFFIPPKMSSGSINQPQADDDHLQPLQVPIIDLSLLRQNSPTKSLIIQQLHQACQNLGFFHVCSSLKFTFVFVNFNTLHDIHIGLGCNTRLQTFFFSIISLVLKFIDDVGRIYVQGVRH